MKKKATQIKNPQPINLNNQSPQNKKPYNNKVGGGRGEMPTPPPKSQQKLPFSQVIYFMQGLSAG